MLSLELLPLYMALLATLGLIVAIFKYLFSVRLGPLEKRCEEFKEQNDDLEDTINDLKQLIIEEVKKISKENFDFRIRYEKGINELKLLLAEKHVSKQVLYKELERLDNKITLSHDIKEISQTLKDLT